jgi:hypothetical protein
MQCTHLCDVEEQEGHHEREKTSSFGEGETENGVLEELTPEGGVAGNTLDEATENRSDTNTGTSKTNGSETGTLDLSGGDHGGSGGLGDDATLLDDVAGGVGAESAAGSNEAVLGGLAGCEMRVNGCVMELELDEAQWGPMRQAHNIPALEKPRAATRAAPKERAMATMVMVLTTGVEMDWR